MPKYRADPYWIRVRFKGSACVRCKRLIRPGGRAFYYPQGHALYCRSEDCGKEASRGFNAGALDEETTDQCRKLAVSKSSAYGW